VKRKIIITTVSCIVLFSAVACQAQWTIQGITWLAANSNFEENPSQGTGRVWGDNFNTRFYGLTAKRELGGGFDAELGGNFGDMLKNRMYLDSTANFTDFSGMIWQVKLMGGYSLVKTSRFILRLSAGCEYLDILKNFYDHTISGQIVAPGNWGSYAAVYRGFSAGATGGIRIFNGIGIMAGAWGSPYLLNSTAVSGMEEYSTLGRSYAFEGKLKYSAPKGLAVFAGYRYQKYYFEGDDQDSFYDLDINYGGPVLGLDWGF